MAGIEKTCKKRVVRIDLTRDLNFVGRKYLETMEKLIITLICLICLPPCFSRLSSLFYSSSSTSLPPSHFPSLLPGRGNTSISFHFGISEILWLVIMYEVAGGGVGIWGERGVGIWGERGVPGNFLFLLLSSGSLFPNPLSLVELPLKLQRFFRCTFHFYERVCPLVRRSVGQSVRPIHFRKKWENGTFKVQK